MAALTEFLPYVMPYTSGCGDAVAVLALQNAVNEFCDQSNILQERLTPRELLDSDTVVGEFEAALFAGLTVNGALHYPILSAGSARFTAPLPANLRPLRLLAVEADGVILRPIAAEYVNRASGWEATGGPRFFSSLPGKVPRLLPVPTLAVTPLTVTLSLTTVSSGTDVPDILFAEYREPIAAGALARVLRTPGRSYTDLRLAAEAERTFRHGWAMARAGATRGRTTASLVATGAPWA